jgi:hypothetical protein
MADIVLGVLAILVGLMLCFGGQMFLRFVFPIWGAFAGFSFGAGLVAAWSDESFLGSAFGVILGIVFALIFAIFAYFFYAAGVVIAMAAIGFAIGSGLMVALGIDWNWVAVIVGVVVGALLGVGAVIINAPMLLLILVSSFAGAIVVVTGGMLLTGAIESANFSGSTFVDRVDDDWWWYALFVVLAVMGILSQARSAAAMRRGMREAWSSSSL